MEGYFKSGMYEKGLSLAEIILGKCEQFHIDTTGGIAGIYRMKAEMLIGLALESPNENRQHRIKEAENSLFRAFQTLENKENRYQEVFHEEVHLMSSLLAQLHLQSSERILGMLSSELMQ